MKSFSSILALLGLSTLALVAPAVVQANDEPKYEKCPSGRLFCVHSQWTDKIYYCHIDGQGFDMIRECAADEACVGRPIPDEQEPSCSKQTTTTHKTTTPWKSSSAPWPYLPEVQSPTATATAGPAAPRALLMPNMCDSPMVFCASTGEQEHMAYCGPGVHPRIVHQCAIGEYCVGTADASKHNADLHCAKESPTPELPPITRPSPPDTAPKNTALALIGLPDAPKVFCDGQKIMYTNHKAALEIVHTCGMNEYCIGNDNPWEGRVQLSCQWEDPLVSTPGHSHPTPTPTSSPSWKWTPSSRQEPPPRRTAPTEPLPTEVAAALDNLHNGPAEASVNVDPYYCGHCINMEGKVSWLNGLGVCNNLPEGRHYRACANEYCGLCIIFRDRDCQGVIIHWGGPNEGSYDATAGQSHYCI